MTEIFRHFRPVQFDRSRVTVTPLKNGGVSYMLRPTEQRQYDFWIYICPLDAEFSARAAVKRLRDVADDGVAPWGRITMSESKLIDLLVSATTQTDLPTEVGKLVEKIYRHNYAEEIKMKMIKNKNAKDFYEAG